MTGLEVLLTVATVAMGGLNVLLLIRFNEQSTAIRSLTEGKASKDDIKRLEVAANDMASKEDFERLEKRVESTEVEVRGIRDNYITRFEGTNKNIAGVKDAVHSMETALLQEFRKLEQTLNRDFTRKEELAALREEAASARCVLDAEEVRKAEADSARKKKARG